MKKISFLFVGFIFLLVFCHKKDQESNPKIVTTINHLKTELGGCNINPNLYPSGQDSVIISFKNDTLNMLVGINYKCCTAFTTNCQIKNDTILAVLNDTCSNTNNYCRCTCYYTSNFKFTNPKNKEYPYKIMLNVPLLGYSTLFRSGTIKLK
jgi:hypothetical protein